MRRSNFASQVRTLLIMAPLQKLIDAAVHGCAVHMAVDTLAFDRHWSCLRSVDVLITPPASYALAHGAFGTLEFLPVPVIVISQDIKDF